METKEINLETVTLPTPVNRYLLCKNPVPVKDVKSKSGIITAITKEKEHELLMEKVKEKLNEKFPDGTMRYEVVSKADDCTLAVKSGQFIILSYSGKSRPHEYVLDGDYMLISEGDVAAYQNYETRTNI